MKKLVVLILMLVLCVCLVGCQAQRVPIESNTPSESVFVQPDPGDIPETEPSDPVLTDFNTGAAEQHETVLPWDYEEDEQVDNIFYKRTTDENGEPVYAVKLASNEQPFYLPMNSTVIYSGDFEESYFERYTVTYKENGESKSMVQYQLHVMTDSVESEVKE